MRILSAPRTAEAHRALLSALPAMNAVQLGGVAQSEFLPAEFTIAAWNVERCLFPEATADHLGKLSPDIVLLSEVDHGMARTAQRHTTEVMAAKLGMAYAFGVEFHELDLGGPTERGFCQDDFNTLGWHGNAVLSSVPFERTALIRLDDHGHWFAADEGAGDPNQPRVGGRNAIAAVVPTVNGPICVVSTHLESNANAAHRRQQFERLLNAIDGFAPGLPVMIGGDLNTGNHLPPDFDWQRETLFKLAETHGYNWSFTAQGTTTRPSLITPHPDRVMKLDWLAGRNLSCRGSGVLSSISDEGTPLSDHDCVWCRAGF
ncbi:endonuclease/exonuclease/phosphatase family protein [Ruegeria sp. Ofav3-42]|uniref:endonuclease/exonuclease/phosphatase family protein n=1 Tax=Ruegeria sp. Ofav3-42 TaxID=2917759 RepID=UPI001EF614AE|nr:endonuclease/exonuclease/phosphatase family protein [Ruegeria sp. Ofav3-42]MCG7519990.1 endonuclease/exonuclease/phosphatase family protein [Ruegeria sp. Ofav3-42]